MNWILSDLLKGVREYEILGDDLLHIINVQLDSRKVCQGSLFCALKGTDTNGHMYISNAIDNGAIAVLCEEWPDVLNPKISYIRVSDGREACAIIAATFYNNPSSKLKCVGVTGTNGKSTVVTLLYNLFKELGYAVGLVSTIEILVKEEHLPSRLTTPDVITMQELLDKMVIAGCTHVFMEVSSHAVDQRRVAGIHFAGGVFTNISHDHLDYHHTFAAYIKAKQAFFTSLQDHSFALFNEDDRNGKVMIEHTKAKTYGYSLRTLTDFKAKLLGSETIGTHVEIAGHKLMTRLVGKFNMYNLLAVYGVAKLLEDIPDDVLLTTLSGLKGAKGRMEVVATKPRVIVDYAHTPDALLNVLKSIRVGMDSSRILITVIGCGGDRDKIKRPMMAQIACEYSDRVILTSDNPRSEHPQDIIDDMLHGLDQYARSKVLEIVDRRSAIRTAIALCSPTDTVLIAGKGHEQYQEISGEKFFFSDQEIVKEIVKDILSKDI